MKAARHDSTWSVRRRGRSTQSESSACTNAHACMNVPHGAKHAHFSGMDSAWFVLAQKSGRRTGRNLDILGVVFT